MTPPRIRRQPGENKRNEARTVFTGAHGAENRAPDEKKRKVWDKAGNRLFPTEWKCGKPCGDKF